MDNAEKRQIQEIESVKNDIEKTKSKQRKNQLTRHLMKLKKELQIYKQLKYGQISF